MTQLYIVNTTDGPFKIPFKLNVSYDVQKKICGLIGVGKRCLIPSEVTPYIDEERLLYHEQKREIRVIRKSTEVPKVGKVVFQEKIVKMGKKSKWNKEAK